MLSTNGLIRGFVLHRRAELFGQRWRDPPLCSGSGRTRVYAFGDALLIILQPVWYLKLYDLNTALLYTRSDSVGNQQALLAADADPNKITKSGNTALRAAVLLGDGDLISASRSRAC